MHGQEIPIRVAGHVTCLAVTGNTAVIKFDGSGGTFNFGTSTVTLVDNGGAGLDRFAASSSFSPDDCSPGFALSGLPLNGRAVVSDDIDYRAFDTRINSGPSGPHQRQHADLQLLLEPARLELRMQG